MSVNSISGYREYPFYINFFRLRPELFWFIVSYAILFTAVLTVKWSNRIKVDESDFKQMHFEMVELKIQAQDKAAAPEIVEDEEIKEEVVKKENKLQFGDSNGRWDIAFLGKPPRPLYTSMPGYPKTVRDAGVEGQVIIELGINSEGIVMYGRIVKSLHPLLDMISMKWIQKQKFTPARDSKGNVFNCKIFLPVTYKLNS